MTDIRPPKIGPTGTYDPADLLRFFGEADAAKVAAWAQAQALRVPMDRFIFIRKPEQMRRLARRATESSSC